MKTENKIEVPRQKIEEVIKITKKLQELTGKKIIFEAINDPNKLKVLLTYFQDKAMNDNSMKFLTAEGKTLWAGIGNTSGLHSYASEITKEKWEKSGERFLKKLKEYLLSGGVVKIYRFKNINRDRGKWILIASKQL